MPKYLIFGVLLVLATSLKCIAREHWKFAFDERSGFTRVAVSDQYSDERGFGFEPGASLSIVKGRSSDGSVLEATAPFYFSAQVPEGNYRVTVRFGGGSKASQTTVKAELRRLMVEHVLTDAGQTVERTFIVNVRRSQIRPRDAIGAGSVKLKAPREVVQEAWAWDDRLTLEFDGTAIAIASIEIDPVQVPTLYIMGDSTVCDQSGEPYASWGQMLTRWFKPSIAIANHAESGETYDAAFARRRIDKILSVIEPGDFFIVQFGHNDQKEDLKSGRTAFTHYQQNIERCVGDVRAKGGAPLLVTPMERRQFNPDGTLHPSLVEYAEAVRRVGLKLDVPVIDLNAMSQVFYRALEARGKGDSAKAFALTDTTHHNDYGAYELSRCVALGIWNANTKLKTYLFDQTKSFDPAHPEDPDAFDLPASPKKTTMRPLGDRSKGS